MTSERPRIGISACLGEPVRFDAGHKGDPFLVETFGPHVEWVQVCPEVEAGFGTPRESMRLMLLAPEPRERGGRFEPSSGRGVQASRERAPAMAGYFKNTLDSDARAEPLALIGEHRLGQVPLIVPMTLVRHHLRRKPVPYLAGQTYLEPHPRELSLRNHV